MIQNEKLKYNISLSDDQISQMSKRSFKKIVDQKIEAIALLELLKCKKSKAQNIISYFNNKNKTSMQPYLKTEMLSTVEKRTLFLLRSKNFNVKSNHKYMFDISDMKCRICLDPESYEDEIHTFLECQILLDGLSVDKKVKFEDIYGPLNLQIPAVKNFIKIIDKRNIMLELREQN